MKPNPQTVFDQALSLPKNKRALLAERLLASLETTAKSKPADESGLPMDLEEAIEVAETRWQLFQAGKMKAIPAEEIFPDLKIRAKGRK